MTVQQTLAVPGAPDIKVRLRRNARARRLSLRVSRLDGRVTLSLPQSVPLSVAEAFVTERADWVRRHVASQPLAEVPDLGCVLPVGDDLAEVRAVPRSARGYAAGRIGVDAQRPVAPQVAGVLKSLARDRLARAVEAYADAVGCRPARLTLRDPRSRWGSCTCAGNLMFSWRLVLAPSAVLDYVAAHEVAHLREMNHGPRFWALVARLRPDYAAHRLWLRDNGADLHRWRFNGS